MGKAVPRAFHPSEAAGRCGRGKCVDLKKFKITIAFLRFVFLGDLQKMNRTGKLDIYTYFYLFYFHTNF